MGSDMGIQNSGSTNYNIGLINKFNQTLWPYDMVELLKV